MDDKKTCAKFVEDTYLNLVSVLQSPNPDNAALRIMEDMLGGRFYRVTEFPEELDLMRSNFIIVRDARTVMVCIGDPVTLNTLKVIGCTDA